MEKPMRYVGDQIVTRSQLKRNARCDAFQTVTLQTEVTESNLLKPDDGGHGGGVTLSGEVRPDGWSFHLKAEQPWYRPEEMRLQLYRFRSRGLFISISLCTMVMPHRAISALAIGYAGALRRGPRAQGSPGDTGTGGKH